MKKIKLGLFISLLTLISSSIVFWYSNDSFSSLQSALQSQNSWNEPYYYFEPVTNNNARHVWTNSWYKWYCDASLNVKVRWISTPYSSLSFYVKFDPSLLQNFAWVANTSVWAFVSQWINQFAYWRNDLFNLGWVPSAELWWTAERLGTISFKPNNTWFNKIWFDLCNSEWWNCTPYEQTTSVQLWLAYTTLLNSSNSLWSVKWAIYDLYAWPCTPDTNAPTITGILNNKVYTWVQTLTWLIYDRSTSIWNYWFGGTNPYSETWVNYVYRSSNDIDNQEWVDHSLTTVSISCPTCGWSDQRLSPTHTPNAWTTDRNIKTWDSHDRWYVVSFTTPELKLERPTTVTMTWCDLPNETWARHCTSTSFTFNKKTNPSITGGYNTNGTEWRTNNVFPSSTNEYMIVVSDNPAGINPDSITITFNESTDLSGNTKPTYILSWSELALTASWVVTDYWVRTIYEVRFHPPYDLLEWTQTNMVVSVNDYVWNTGTKTFNLNTRAACSSFGGCRDYLNINHFGDVMGNEFTRLFSWLNIVVTGDINSIYPYLEWDRLYCGLPFSWATLIPQWGMNLYKYGDGNRQSSLTLTDPDQNVIEATNSADVDHDFSRDENNRNMIKDIYVY